MVALWIAARDDRVRWPAKLVAGMVAAYAVSPIDLIPDFIPVFGLLDDLILLPAGVWLAVRLIPPALMREFRDEAASREGRPTSRIAAALIVSLWIVAAAVSGWLLLS